jgi:hypothetical protein
MTEDKSLQYVEYQNPDENCGALNGYLIDSFAFYCRALQQASLSLEYFFFSSLREKEVLFALNIRGTIYSLYTIVVRVAVRGIQASI